VTDDSWIGSALDAVWRIKRLAESRQIVKSHLQRGSHPQRASVAARAGRLWAAPSPASGSTDHCEWRIPRQQPVAANPRKVRRNMPRYSPLSSTRLPDLVRLPRAAWTRQGGGRQSGRRARRARRRALGRAKTGNPRKDLASERLGHVVAPTTPGSDPANPRTVSRSRPQRRFAVAHSAFLARAARRVGDTTATQTLTTWRRTKAYLKWPIHRPSQPWGVVTSVRTSMPGISRPNFGGIAGAFAAYARTLPSGPGRPPPLKPIGSPTPPARA